MFQASYGVVMVHETLLGTPEDAVKTLCTAVLPVSEGWEDVQSEPFFSVISDKVASCLPVLVTSLLSLSDSSSLLLLAINAGLAEDQIEEPNCVPASSSSLDNSSSVSQKVIIFATFHHQISLFAVPC